MALKARLGTALTTLVAYVVTILIVFPIVWMALTGFKDEVSAYQMPPSLVFTPILDNLNNALNSGIMRYVYHSGVAVGVSTIAALALGIPAAFALVWHPRKSNESILFWLISTKFMPAVGVLIPLYVIFKDVHLLDTLWALIIVYTAVNLPLVVWIMYSFFSDIPKDLLEAGRVDGASDWQVFVLTHSATALGIVSIAWTVPITVLVLLGGVAADRLPRRLVLLTSDAGRAAVVLGIAVLGWLHHLAFWHLVLLVIIFSIVDAFFGPAYASVFPELVEQTSLSSANALTNASQQIGKVVGPLLAGVMIASSGPALAFAFDAFTFVVSGVCLAEARS